MIITVTPRAENALRNLNTSIMRCNNLAAFSKLTESSTAPRLEFDKLLMLSWSRAVFWRREYEDATGSRINGILPTKGWSYRRGDSLNARESRVG